MLTKASVHIVNYEKLTKINQLVNVYFYMELGNLGKDCARLMSINFSKQ